MMFEIMYLIKKVEMIILNDLQVLRFLLGVVS